MRACALDFQDSWDKYLPLVVFSYNNSYQSTVAMAPYEAFYGWKYRSPVHWDEVAERKYLGLELVERATKAIKKIQERMKIVALKTSDC